MFSRIGCCVEYADLTVEQKQKIVNNWYDSIMASLKDDERVYIETTDIHEWFLKNAERYDNIRILKSKMENAIFEKLTDHFIIMTGSMAEGTQDSLSHHIAVEITARTGIDFLDSIKLGEAAFCKNHHTRKL